MWLLTVTKYPPADQYLSHIEVLAFVGVVYRPFRPTYLSDLW